jgi:hypothetical protein
LRHALTSRLRSTIGTPRGSLITGWKTIRVEERSEEWTERSEEWTERRAVGCKKAQAEAKSWRTAKGWLRAGRHNISHTIATP